MRAAIRIGMMLCGLLALSAFAAHAQQITARSRLASDTLRVGIPARLQLEVLGLPDTPVWLPFTVDTLSNIAIIETTPWTTRAGGWLKEMRFIPLANGQIRLPGLAVQQVTGSDTVYSNPLVLQALLDTSLIKGPDIRPVKDIVREGVKWYDYLIYLWIILGIATVFGLIYLWRRLRQQRSEPVAAQTIVQSPEDVAFEKLRKLRDAELWQSGAIKAYQSELTFILREYLEKQFKFPALEQPSSDIVKQLHTITSNNDWISRIRQILERADLVKFAKGDPGATFHQEALENTIGLIKASLDFLPKEDHESQES